MPFLAVTGNVPTSQFGRGAFQELYRQHQADFPSTVRSICKKVYQPTRGEQVPMMVRQAWKTMVTGRPGPVVLDVPFDVFMESAAEETPKPEEWSANISSRCGADPGRREEGRRHAARGRAAGDPRRPGRQIRRRDRRSAGACGEAANSGGAFDERHRRHRHAAIRWRWGCSSRGGAYQANGAARQADVLLALGVRFDDRTSSSWIPGYSFTIPPTKLIHVDIDPEEIGRNYPVALGLMADVRTFLRQVLAELDTRKGVADAAASRGKWLATIDGYRKEWEKFIAPGFIDDSTPIHPQRAAAEIDKALPDDAIMVSDIGVHHNWLLQFCKPKRPDSFIGCMGFGAMGFGVAGVLGAKFAAPDRPCVSVCGDGAFFMHANVLGTAVEYNLPVRLGGLEQLRLCVDPRIAARLSWTAANLATDFKHPDTGKPYNPDFAAMARSAGVEGVRVDRAGDIGNAIRHGDRRQQAVPDRRQHQRRPESRRRRRLGAARPRRQQGRHRRAVSAVATLQFQSAKLQVFSLPVRHTLPHGRA